MVVKARRHAGACAAPGPSGTGVPAFDGAFAPTVFDVTERTAFPNGVTLTRRGR
ncbi:hypothetical protein [Streptomyces antibioticus]|uniref:hypothetical protein n=1 Tax=Streptomyces antibioticus TaxID=1890 RepID=UPI003D73CA4C